MGKKRDFTIPATGIDQIEKVILGGVGQSILIQGEDPAKPVLLFVHGGPCMPVPGVVSRGQDYNISVATKELVKHFVVVFWDQRGAGKSFSTDLPADSFRIERFIADCLELIDMLRNRFTHDKIYLAAHSWGTVIGLSAAARHPEKLHAYIGISQLLNWVENDTLAYKWVKKKAEDKNDRRTLKMLDKLGLPPYVESVGQWTGFRRPLIKYKSLIHTSETVKHPGMLGGFRLFWRSADYSVADIFNTFYSSYRLTYTQALIEDFAALDLHAVKRLDVPAFFLHGTEDHHVNGNPVKRFVEAVEAPLGKELHWFDQSSHMFHPDDARKIEQFLIRLPGQLQQTAQPITG